MNNKHSAQFFADRRTCRYSQYYSPSLSSVRRCSFPPPFLKMLYTLETVVVALAYKKMFVAIHTELSWSSFTFSFSGQCLWIRQLEQQQEERKIRRTSNTTWFQYCTTFCSTNKHFCLRIAVIKGGKGGDILTQNEDD